MSSMWRADPRAFAESGSGSGSDDGACVRWLAAPAATEHDLAQVLRTVHRRVGRVDEDGDDTGDALAGCVQLSLAGPQRIAAPTAPPRPLEVSAFGMSLHAATVIDGRDRKRLERMCRYLLRPPFAHDAVLELPDGRVRLSFKSPTRSGATRRRSRAAPISRATGRTRATTAAASGPLLRRIRQPSQPARAHPSQARRTTCGRSHADAAVRCHRPAPVGRGCRVQAHTARQSSPRVGLASGQGFFHRYFGLSPLRWTSPRDRGHHRPRGDSDAPARRKATTSPVVARPALLLSRLNLQPPGPLAPAGLGALAPIFLGRQPAAAQSLNRSRPRPEQRARVLQPSGSRAVRKALPRNKVQPPLRWRRLVFRRSPRMPLQTPKR